MTFESFGERMYILVFQSKNKLYSNISFYYKIIILHFCSTPSTTPLAMNSITTLYYNILYSLSFICNVMINVGFSTETDKTEKIIVQRNDSKDKKKMIRMIFFFIFLG